MRLLIDIPKEFASDWVKDRFADALHRLSADAHLLAGTYEQEIAKMLIVVFQDSKQTALEDLHSEEFEQDSEYNRGYSDGVQKGYEDFVRNYRQFIQSTWTPANKNPTKPDSYLCTLYDNDGSFIDVCEWSNTFGGRWQVFFEQDDSYFDVKNVIAWMPLPPVYDKDDHYDKRGDL